MMQCRGRPRVRSGVAGGLALLAGATAWWWHRAASFALPGRLPVDRVVAELAAVLPDSSGVRQAPLAPRRGLLASAGPRDALIAPPGSRLPLRLRVPPEAVLAFSVGVEGAAAGRSIHPERPRPARRHAARRSARLLRGRAEPEPDARRARRAWRAVRVERRPRALDDAVDGFDPDRPLPARPRRDRGPRADVARRPPLAGGGGRGARHHDRRRVHQPARLARHELRAGLRDLRRARHRDEARGRRGREDPDIRRGRQRRLPPLAQVESGPPLPRLPALHGAPSSLHAAPAPPPAG